MFIFSAQSLRYGIETTLTRRTIVVRPHFYYEEQRFPENYQDSYLFMNTHAFGNKDDKTHRLT